MQVLEYLDREGRSVFGRWFDDLDSRAAAKVAIAVARLSNSNLSGLKSVGGGVLEDRIDFGPGYRIYLGRDGDTIVILLGGGTKRRQQRDIEAARLRWDDYRKRKRGQ